ncbi:hypothetical protein IscW_ISCW017369 [Ixodes scapularis]|uniref:Uncharacterized protein n=1 Tax=Ixodes scapularis TaxID=6945 RepID=B7PD44_IXOSC|nr:hypothetical protein IscW_ISCW017369 [Ixodes scapularis]|eukprot:XP_002410606.1 hypothetical protein IscW_ISCW017369 [Ixodes scapularis]
MRRNSLGATGESTDDTEMSTSDGDSGSTFAPGRKEAAKMALPSISDLDAPRRNIARVPDVKSMRRDENRLVQGRLHPLYF